MPRGIHGWVVLGEHEDGDLLVPEPFMLQLQVAGALLALRGDEHSASNQARILDAGPQASRSERRRAASAH